MTWPRAIVGAAAVAMAAAAAAAQEEVPAPADPFTITAGPSQERFIGAVARLDIRHPGGGQPPSMEIAIAGTDAAGRTWSALAVAPSTFAHRLSLEARVTDRPLAPGDASVQSLAAADAQARFAAEGTLQVSLHAGRLAGRADGAASLFPATFEGPVAVSCAVPAEALGGSRPAPAAPDVPLSLVVDERFESALCQPYAAWGVSRR